MYLAPLATTLTKLNAVAPPEREIPAFSGLQRDHEKSRYLQGEDGIVNAALRKGNSPPGRTAGGLTLGRF